MIITKKALARRMFLRGLGAAVALPLLDAMVPAATLLARTPARGPVRFGAIYLPNGVAMPSWTPAAEGSAFEITPILKPLEPDDPRYIAFYNDAALTSADPIASLARTIEWSPLESKQLFSGFRGTGKSTELRRLRKMRSAGDNTRVVLCNMEEYLNLTTPVDISDFLVSVAGAFSDELQRDRDARDPALGHRARAGRSHRRSRLIRIHCAPNPWASGGPLMPCPGGGRFSGPTPAAGTRTDRRSNRI